MVFTKGNSTFTALSWVSRVVRTNAVRSWQRCVHIEKEKKGWDAVATDGKRMHRVFTENSAMFPVPGDYVIGKRNKTCIELIPQGDMGFPLYRNVFPKEPVLTGREKIRGINDPWYFVAQIARAYPGNFCLDHILDALPTGVDEIEFRYAHPDDSKVVLFDTDLGPFGHYQALVCSLPEGG
jgi:hypothetical protein